MTEEKKYTLTPEQVSQAFMGAGLEENYNFLQDDLMKLSQAFIDAAQDAIVKGESVVCVKFVRSLNTLVAEKLAEYRHVE